MDKELLYTCDEIMVADLETTNNIIEDMKEILSAYGEISVSDLYDAVGLSSRYMDTQYGWTDISSAEIITTAHGYALKMPEATSLKKKRKTNKQAWTGGRNMDTIAFDRVIDEQIDHCKDVLKNKAREYATEDRLHNFNVAAGLQGCSTKQALAGMMSKHTVSIYDMCRSNEDYSEELWNEKITDSINYLLLLKAAITADRERKTSNKKEDI